MCSDALNHFALQILWVFCLLIWWFVRDYVYVGLFLFVRLGFYNGMTAQSMLQGVKVLVLFYPSIYQQIVIFLMNM